MASTQQPTYLDLQARIGITKHTGGYPATERLLDLCRVREGSEVLYVGSGIGVGPAHLARTRRARVVATDISEQMLAWTRIRARRDHVAHLVSTQRADVLDLPFPAGSFDVVLVESVLAFVVDKQQAISECVRVTRSGGGCATFRPPTGAVTTSIAQGARNWSSDPADAVPFGVASSHDHAGGEFGGGPVARRGLAVGRVLHRGPTDLGTE